MNDSPDRGMATAEYTAGTLGAVVIATLIFQFAHDSDWLGETLKKVIERALSPTTLIEHLKRVPRFGLGLR